MTERRWTLPATDFRHRFRAASALATAIICGATPDASALSDGERTLWDSDLSGLIYLQIEREISDPSLDAEEQLEIPAGQRFDALPSSVLAALGPHQEDYESFVATHLSEEELSTLEPLLLDAGLQYWLRQPQADWLGHRRADAGGEVGTDAAWVAAGIERAPVPGRFLLEIGYPVKDSWLSNLRDCGALPIAFLEQRTLLVDSPSLDQILACPLVDRFARLGSFFNTDRISPDTLSAEEDQWARGWWLEYGPETSLEEITTELPVGVTIVEHYSLDDSSTTLVHAVTDEPSLHEIVASSRLLVSVTPDAEATPSDERQGQILAGNHNNSSVTSTGYRNWLNNRGLLSATHQQTIAVFDTGYEDGVFVNHHPDLSNPIRLVDARHYVGSGFHDARGHGTVVAGIIAGDGTSGVGTGAADPQGFNWGTGIAPGSKIVAIKIFDSAVSDCKASSDASLDTLESALNYSRNDSSGFGKALLSNHSWNRTSDDYDAHAQFFDDRVVDASTTWTGDQPMTIVFAAGNAGSDPDTVRSPALAKNVITVGATESYRPVSQSGQPPNSCQTLSSSQLQDATHIARIAKISGRGFQFDPWPESDRLDNVRVKPDLVAPGVRITSTVPYDASTYTCGDRVNSGLCAEFFPDGPGHEYHSYASGTSFAAPAVTAVAGLKRKWFLDRGIDAAPSLLKAALIATADDLGWFSEYNGDHRPSWHYGWGRVNLNRATDSVPRFYVNESSTLPVQTGTTRTWTRTIHNPSSPTYIVLAWSDQPSTTDDKTSQVPLVNDLSLRVDRSGSSGFWRGNNMRENRTGTDDGFSHAFVVGGDPILTDSMNNVEVVFIPAGTFLAGEQVTIRVTGDNVPSGPQRFSVYAYNVKHSS